MISLWSNDCLMNSWLNIPYDCMKFISYASYRNNIRKKVKFWPKIKIPLALDIKNWGFQLKMARGGSRGKKMQKLDCWSLTVDQAVDLLDIKSPFALHFSPVLLHTLKTFHIPTSRSQFWQDFGPIAGCGFDFGLIWNPVFQFLGVISLWPCASSLDSASSPCA